jgi:folate-binding protein YgfZ
MKVAWLPDRGVVRLSGEDAWTFLNGLVTTDVSRVTRDHAGFGALLTPQGKIITDFLIAQNADGDLLLDCPRPLAAALATKLGFYKLRAKVVVENLSDAVTVAAIWDSDPAASEACVFADPRNELMGYRILAPRGIVETLIAANNAEVVDASAYDAHRITHGVPAGGADFAYGDAFPHDANMDRLHGVDFTKGCYVGQEVVSRMQHRGTARTRIVRVMLDGAAAAGATIMAGDKSIGTLGSSVGSNALALLRLDRAADALDAGLGFSADGHAVTLIDPADLRLPPKHQTVA